ncbi:MAG: BMP family ABC transporter substrate-binding protein [Alkalispirochaetaceae bacterium]
MKRRTEQRRRSAIGALALIVASALLAVPSLFGEGQQETTQAPGYSIAVFVPGVVEGSPTYEMLVDGVERAAQEEENVSVRVVEGGFNQAAWEQGVTQLASSERYDLIVTSNPSMPEIAATVAESFPEQRFLVMDGYLEGNDAIHTVLFNQREQAYIIGYFAGLVTSSSMEQANEANRIGLLAGQEYPIMNEVILPGVQLGLETVVGDAEVDFRVLGNWHDAGKAAELAADMYDRDADVILAIAGGGNQGVLAAAREKSGYVLWYDASGYEQAPGIVVGSSLVKQDIATYERTRQAIRGDLAFGEAEILGARDGYVGFVTDSPHYAEHVPESIREEMTEMLQRFEDGEISLEMPNF